MLFTSNRDFAYINMTIPSNITTIGLLGGIETAAFQDLLPPSDSQPYPKGLGGSPVNLLARELHRRGYSLVIYTLDPSVEQQITLQGERLTIHFGPYRQKRARDFFAEEIRWLKNAVRQHPTDILHAHWTYEFALAAQATGLPVLVTAHDAPLNILRLNFIPYRIIRTLMACRAIWKSRYISVVSPYVADHLRNCLFYRRSTRVISNGLPDAIFNRVKPPRPANAPFTFATILVGWSGRKNGEAAIQAFAILRNSHPDCRLLMFGSGHGLEDPAYAWAKSLNLEHGIEFAGQLPYQDLMQRVCNEVDAVVHPALEESQGMALIEPMAMGIPVIGGKAAGAVPWTLDNGRAGLLVDVTRPEEIAAAMSQLITETAERQQLIEAGLAHVKKCFHISAVTDAYLQAYQDILEGTWA